MEEEEEGTKDDREGVDIYVLITGPRLFTLFLRLSSSSFFSIVGQEDWIFAFVDPPTTSLPHSFNS